MKQDGINQSNPEELYCHGSSGTHTVHACLEAFHWTPYKIPFLMSFKNPAGSDQRPIQSKPPLFHSGPQDISGSTQGNKILASPYQCPVSGIGS